MPTTAQLAAMRARLHPAQQKGAFAKLIRDGHAAWLKDTLAALNKNPPDPAWKANPAAKYFYFSWGTPASWAYELSTLIDQCSQPPEVKVRLRQEMTAAVNTFQAAEVAAHQSDVRSYEASAVIIAGGALAAYAAAGPAAGGASGVDAIAGGATTVDVTAGDAALVSAGTETASGGIIGTVTSGLETAGQKAMTAFVAHELKHAPPKTPQNAPQSTQAPKPAPIPPQAAGIGLLALLLLL